MATLDALKSALRAATPSSCKRCPLSHEEYSVGFSILASRPQSIGGSPSAYEKFITPQLTQILVNLTNSNGHLSILEVGPGPKSILESVPEPLRRKINHYLAFEPNFLFAKTLADSLLRPDPAFPCLHSTPDIRKVPFTLRTCSQVDGKFDLILFGHSMYGMKPKSSFIQQSLRMLANDTAMVVVFHRESLDLDGSGLVAQHTASFPTGEVASARADGALDSFAAYIAGFGVANDEVKTEWRNICRRLGRLSSTLPSLPTSSTAASASTSPEIMVGFTQHATALEELTDQVAVIENKTIKNREARVHHPAAIMRPTKISHVQACVRWAIKHGFGLTVVGGGHSGQCVVPNVVAVDMGAFDKVHVIKVEYGECTVVAGGGCKSGDIIKKALASGLTVPLGARPSVGAGLWLQGGIGHLSRRHGLSCDVIIGAVVINLQDGQILCVGSVPKEHQPDGAVRPADEDEWLWAMKGAGTNFGIVVMVTLKAFTAHPFMVATKANTFNTPTNTSQNLSTWFQKTSGYLSRRDRSFSTGTFLYAENTDRICYGINTFIEDGPCVTISTQQEIPFSLRDMMGWGVEAELVDAMALFDKEMYMSTMHGGHGGGKTSAFKRCVFLKDLVSASTPLVSAFLGRPTEFCYYHLIHGRGAIEDVVPEASAFGCRDWDFACVITGVWPREQDGTEISRSAIQWVYKVVEDLLPLSFCVGVYGADLGPDPRDAPLATRAFGLNLPRLCRLKLALDPHNVLRYACPITAATEPKLVIIVTGETCTGKDYCAGAWASMFMTRNITARTVSISENAKREFATKAQPSVNLDRLLTDRAYKEQHRAALTAFFAKQVKEDRKLPQKHFLSLVLAASSVNVLLITGMRDEAPLATFAHLVPNSRVIEVRVTASKETRMTRLGSENSSIPLLTSPPNKFSPTFTFPNDTQTHPPVTSFFNTCLLPFVSQPISKLHDLIRPVPSFPRQGITFQHILGIAQQPGGLRLVTSLLTSLYHTPWKQISHVVSCEAGGFVFASALACSLDKPLAIIRKKTCGSPKLPPPTLSVAKEGVSHISGCSPGSEKRKVEEKLEIDRDIIPKDGKVVIIDDVLATGRTLCSILELVVGKVGLGAENVSVLVVAEFPAHKGREMLKKKGFGEVAVGSLVVFGGL
ncbi:adenine phosphoribosyltransferase [Cladorrhinum sp. PSN259]|nr:adenine phosphoribosyltransferase [Cladorrhinum sp. PSN259]